MQTIKESVLKSDEETGGLRDESLPFAVTLVQDETDLDKALQALEGSDPVAVFGSADAMKLRSSLTLFEAAGYSDLFADALDRWVDGERDASTLHKLA